MNEAAARRKHEDESKRELPLSGYRVLELGSTVAGPFCGRLLADFGAEVIKVEPPEGDAVRWMGKRSQGKSLYAASIFRNKKLIALDLRHPDGRALARDLAERSDFLLENFRPGTMERWGLGYDALSAVNPGLIMIRLSGYGQFGPYSQRPGYGVTCEAMSGLRELTGDPDRPPARAAVSLTDYIAGLYAAFGAMIALERRHHTGRGQVVDTALYEAAFSFTEPHVPAFSNLGHVATRSGPRLPDHTPNSLYPTAEGRYIHITAGSQSVFKRLLKVMDAEHWLADERFAQPEARARNEDLVDATVAEWTAKHTLAELESQLQAAAVPASRIYDMRDIFSDPHFAARKMLLKLGHPALGEVTVPGVVPRLSATPGEVRWPGREVGEDTAQILTDILGLDAEALMRLQAASVIGGTTESGARIPQGIASKEGIR